jgi:sarcosine oxidase
VSARFDVAVIGLGAMGSAAAYHLSRRGLKVVGLDRFAPPHAMGSSLGLTRIIREAYYEHPLYVPLVRRALVLWRDLARDARGTSLLVRNGGLTIGARGGALVRGVLASAHEHGVAHELLAPGQLSARFPAYVEREDRVAVWEPGAGFLRPEAIIETHLALARGLGAELRSDEPATGWRAAEGGVTVRSAGGDTDASHLVIAAGAWISSLLPALELPLRVERQVSHWFESAGAAPFGPAKMPVTMWELDGAHIFYTTPDVGRGVKAGFHHGGETTSADTVRREVAPDEVEEAQRTLRALVPGAAGPSRGSAVCLYTDTPDEHFIIDRYPRHENVVVVSACSGHGFKFSSAVGEIAADLVEGKQPCIDLGPFSVARFQKG